MSWILVGAGVGAGVGSYGHDNWGWSKDAIWQGAAVGGAGGYAMGAGGAATTGGASMGAAPAQAASAAGTGAAQFGSANWAAQGAGMVGGGGSAYGTGVVAGYGPSAMAGVGQAGAIGGGGMMSGLSKPMIEGQAWSNPMMLGQAGMGLASAFSSSGQTPQQKVQLSAAGKKLQEETLKPAIKDQYEKAVSGDARDKAFGSISNLKTQEGARQRASMGILQKAQASMYNTKPNDRGDAAMGGAMLKGQLADAGERMDGLFAPTSALNAFTKEGLMNSVAQIQNMQNRENVVGQFNYQGNLAQWNANQMAASNKGAAIGQTAMMIGGSQLNQAYMDKYKNAMA